MTGYRNILVGFSSERGHENILDDGMAFAKIMNTDIDAIHISDLLEEPIDYMYVSGLELVSTMAVVNKEEIERAREKIKTNIKRLERNYEITADFKVATGNPAQTIVDMSPDYSIVVIGSEIEGKFHKRLLGPIAKNVVRFAESPVIVLKEWQDKKRLKDLKNILVPVDGSNVSNFAAAHAAFIADRVNGQITLLHVWEKKNDKLLTKIKRDNINISEIRNEITTRILDDAETTMMTDVPIKRKILVGDPSDLIAEESKNYDMVVLGTWGRGGVKKFLLGCTAENVAQHADCPVLLVRGIPD